MSERRPRLRSAPPAAAGDGTEPGYGELLAEAKAAVRETRLRAALAVNAELIGLYWRLGRLIGDRRKAEGWGAKVTERLSADLRAEFPGMTGLSPRNLRYMATFAGAWPELGPPPGGQLEAEPFGQQPVAQMGAEAIGQQAVAQIPWGHIVVLLDKLDDRQQREWYAAKTVEHGWSRAVLLNQIMSRLHLRQGAALTNFTTSLPPGESDLVQQLTKDPYHLEFLDLAGDVAERHLEDALVAHLQQFLLELGTGFAFVGRQYRLAVGDEEFFVDLLFYHLRLRRYVVIELKTGRFQPEYAGKLNFYVNVIDDQLRSRDDGPTIGMLLCASRSEPVVRYALHGTSTPLAVASYHYRELPAELQAMLPPEGDLDAALRSTIDEHDPK